MAYKGYIPAKVTYVCAKSETIEEYFEDEDILLSKTKVTPTFPVETGKGLDKAISWTGLKNPKIIENENKPIKNIVIVGLEERGNGGRAYKVIIDNTYYVDMREDVVLDTIFNCGIEKGGKLKGEYVWVKYGANMKLVRTESELYKQFQQGNILNELVEIAKKDLVIGGIYKTKKGDTHLYLGEYQTLVYKEDEVYNSGGKNTITNRRFVKEKVYLFKQIWDFYYPKENYLTCKPEYHLQNAKDHYHNFSVKKTLPKFLIKEGQADLSKFDIINCVQALFIKKNKEDNYLNKHGIDFLKYTNSDILNLSASTPQIANVYTPFNIPITSK